MSGQIITREASWQQLTDHERELLAQGLQKHLIEQQLLPPDISVREVFQMCEASDVFITFFRENGQEKFKMKMDKNKALLQNLNASIDRLIKQKN